MDFRARELKAVPNTNCLHELRAEALGLHFGDDFVDCFPGGIIGRTFASGLMWQSTTTGLFISKAFVRIGLISSGFVILKPSTPKAFASFTKSVALCGSVCEKRLP